MTDLKVEEITQKILALIDKAGRLQADPVRSRAANLEAGELGQILAGEFGRRHGWRQAQSRFTLSALRGGKVHSSRRIYDPSEYFSHPYVDHGFFYRWPDRCAVAVVGHLYDVPEDITAWAVQNGLWVSFPKDFPSWHYPGWTTLVVYLTNPHRMVLAKRIIRSVLEKIPGTVEEIMSSS